MEGIQVHTKMPLLQDLPLHFYIHWAEFFWFIIVETGLGIGRRGKQGFKGFYHLIFRWWTWTEPKQFPLFPCLPFLHGRIRSISCQVSNCWHIHVNLQVKDLIWGPFIELKLATTLTQTFTKHSWHWLSISWLKPLKPNRPFTQIYLKGIRKYKVIRVTAPLKSQLNKEIQCVFNNPKDWPRAVLCQTLFTFDHKNQKVYLI